MTDYPIFFDPPTLADRQFYEHDDECEAEWVDGAKSWTPCRCDERAGDTVHDPDLPLGDEEYAR